MSFVQKEAFSTPIFITYRRSTHVIEGANVGNIDDACSKTHATFHIDTAFLV